MELGLAGADDDDDDDDDEAPSLFSEDRGDFTEQCAKSESAGTIRSGEVLMLGTSTKLPIISDSMADRCCCIVPRCCLLLSLYVR